MAEDTLSTEIAAATVEQNVTNNPTPVVVWDVPDGETWQITEGEPAILDVDASGGGDLPRNTRLGLAYREPNDPVDAWTVVNEFPIGPFNSLPLKDQHSGDNAERRRLSFVPDRVPNGRIGLTDADEVALVMLSSETIDTGSLFFNYPMTVEQA